MVPWLPENISTYGRQIDDLFYLIFYITMVSLVLVYAAMAWCLVRYRYRPGRRAVYTHGNTPLEIIWTIVPAVILVYLALLSKTSWDEIRGTMPPSDYHIDVIAKQFNWDFVYPGPDGKIGTDDDLTLENDLNVPVNEVVRLTLKSEDVIHSFFVPQLRVKQDMLPGREIPLWFEATKPGRYEIPCAELCGFGHSGMRGWLTVHSPEEYARWMQKRWPSAPGGA